MNQSNSNRQNNATNALNYKQTTSCRFSPSQEGAKAAAEFNAKVDKMFAEGWEYYEHIDVSLNEKLLIFKLMSI
jgi:hypothetical protein